MKVIKARNVHAALPEAIRYLMMNGVESESRNGLVVVSPEPVTTVYEKPRERVLFWPERDANPFFHFYEGLWMLGGRQDVRSLHRFVAQIAKYSDDGKTFQGAYGFRWLRHFDMYEDGADYEPKSNQLLEIIANLKANPSCRRQVLGMWDPETDLRGQGEKKDIPCNLAAHFQIQDSNLNMTVFNRSNDIIWGCYGANAVHFSMLQEFVAAAVGVSVGKYWQVSDNWHAYMSVLEPMLLLSQMTADPPYSEGPMNPYDIEGIEPFYMVNTDIDIWLGDLAMFLDEEDKAMGYRDVFFRKVALPMMAAHNTFKELRGEERYTETHKAAEKVMATDWRTAVHGWVELREARYKESVKNG